MPDRAAELHRRAATWYAERGLADELGQVQLAPGRLDAAGRTSQQALNAVAGDDRASLPAAGPAYVGLAGVAYQRDELGRAREYLAPGVALSRSFVYTMPLATGLATLAWVRQADGDAAGARAAMDEAVRPNPVPRGRYWRCWRPAVPTRPSPHVLGKLGAANRTAAVARARDLGLIP